MRARVFSSLSSRDGLFPAVLFSEGNYTGQPCQHAHPAIAKLQENVTGTCRVLQACSVFLMSVPVLLSDKEIPAKLTQKFLIWMVLVPVLIEVLKRPSCLHQICHIYTWASHS